MSTLSEMPNDVGEQENISECKWRHIFVIMKFIKTETAKRVLRLFQSIFYCLFIFCLLDMKSSIDFLVCKEYKLFTSLIFLIKK